MIFSGAHTKEIVISIGTIVLGINRVTIEPKAVALTSRDGINRPMYLRDMQTQSPINNPSNVDHKRCQGSYYYISRTFGYSGIRPLELGNGLFGKSIVSTLFDSGANIMPVDRRLVHKSANQKYTGKYIRCWMFSSRVECFLQCCLFIRSLYYTGLAELCSARKPINLLITVQLKGVWCANQEVQAWYRRNGL